MGGGHQQPPPNTKRRVNAFFQRCFNAAFNPNDALAAQRILALDSDEENCDSRGYIEFDMFQEDKQVNGDASDSPADDKAAEKTAEAGPSEGKDEKPAKKKKPVKKTIPAWAR